jgi:lipopolysaccharide/colanic/teichoic acid biosynthesis glycosyltransferase
MNKTPRRRRRQVFQRFLDMVCSSAGLLLLSPLFAGIALVILLDDGPPILFSQTRVGRNGKRFRIWKFRTMRSGTEGSVVTAAGDSRITRAGARLRRCKLDELPQLVNVLKGDMSLVGPRPEVPEHVDFDALIWRVVLQARPGITDLATLLYRDEERILGLAGDPNCYYREKILPAKLLLNLEYIVSRSFWQDLKLIFTTIRYSLFPEGFNSELIKRRFGAGVGNE